MMRGTKAFACPSYPKISPLSALAICRPVVPQPENYSVRFRPPTSWKKSFGSQPHSALLLERRHRSIPWMKTGDFHDLDGSPTAFGGVSRHMPKRTDLRKILLIGSGPIIIGQACEFDYS